MGTGPEKNAIVGGIYKTSNGAVGTRISDTLL